MSLLKTKMQKQTKWSQQEKEYLILNYNKLTYIEIGKYLGRTWTQVRNQANYLKLTGNSNLGRKYSCNKTFFSTPSILNSYWAGFIAADGCIVRNKLSIGLSIKDAEHLQLFSSTVGYTGRIYYSSTTATLLIACSNYVEDLRKNFNITERKSLTLQPPPLLDKKLVFAYIAGLIDGDGSITKKRKSCFSITICGTKYILDWVKFHFSSIFDSSNYRFSDVRKADNVRQLYCYKISGSRVVSVKNIIEELDLPLLRRKWDNLKG